ncbi:hypothetical protein QAD02_011896 [Eretmocerus hayati]|uniref:Uncharacterized protein n=1 Tax=Eretmocerus hayati TaxID=131215 RepID=A0ACC2P2V0_9HYME|nr:hypothetical protein QAD02_011896 [Eretmocerus hayati]
MDRKDRDKIDYLCDHLLPKLDIEKLWPRLLENRIFNRDDVNISTWQTNLSKLDTIHEICSMVKTRGPRAYGNLVLSLKQSGHQSVVDEIENPGASNGVNHSNNNNSDASSELPSDLSEMSINSSFEQDSEDDYFKKMIEGYEKLVIKVKKATEFRDGPDFENIERYPMRSTPRGYVLLITNIVYTAIDNRPSAMRDREHLKQLFEDMGFKVLIHNDLTGNEIKKTVREFSKMKELRRVDSAFVIISSHGYGEHGKQETEIKGTDYLAPGYETVVCTDIIDYFTAENCPNLCGKPKVFIFQACRGDKHQKAVSLERSVTDAVTKDHVDTDQPYTLSNRNYADTLIAYATLPGYVSYRDKYNGSWFIQILCEVFMNHAYNTHVADLFTMTDSRLKILRTKANECQTLWVVNQGFDRHCFLNPGLHKNAMPT